MNGQELNSITAEAATSAPKPMTKTFQRNSRRELFDEEPNPSNEFGQYEPFVDEEVIARFLQITPRQVLEMARRSEIPRHPIGRGMRKRWRFRISEISEHYSIPNASQGSVKLTSAVPGATRRKQ